MSFKVWKHGAKIEMSDKGYAACNTSWFDKEPEKYLSRDDFKKFQQVSGTDFRDLLSADKVIVRSAQENIASQTRIFNEVRNEHAGYGVPLLYYTYDLSLAQKVSNQNGELEDICFQLDMGDSLRRRHIALYHSILPDEIEKLSGHFGRPITIKNMGSGVGLDVINAIRSTNGRVKRALNYDINAQAIGLGRKITRYLEEKGEIVPGVINYKADNMIRSRGKSMLTLMIGIICGLTNATAHVLLKMAYGDLEEGGKLVVSSSNHHMECADPLASFLIQHIGTRQDPVRGWGLNFRTEEVMRGLLSRVGFKDISIYDDANYPGRERIPDEILYGIDPLPSKVMGHHSYRSPLNLLSKATLEKRTGYNWIAVGTKPG